MKFTLNKPFLLISTLFLLSNCSIIAPASMQSSFKYLSFTKGAIDTASFVKTGKTSTDHFISAFVGKDCRISRIIRKKAICIEIDAKVFKYKLYNKGQELSENNIVKMQFPSEIYDFNKTLENDLQKKLKNSKIKIFSKNNKAF